MTSAQAGQVPVTTYGQQSGERRLDHPAGRLIGAQPFERSVAQTFPRALTILHLHDDHRPDPLRRQIGSQFPEVIAEHGGGAQGHVFRFKVCSCTSSMPRASWDRPDPYEPAYAILPRGSYCARIRLPRRSGSGEISDHNKFICVPDGDLDPVRAAIAGPIQAPFALHDDPFEAHRGAGLHQASALGGRERLRQLHGIARERRPELLHNVLAFLERPAEQRVAVHIHAIEDHYNRDGLVTFRLAA